MLDIATADAVWLHWSERQFRKATTLGPILINPIIYAELAPAFATAADLDRDGLILWSFAGCRLLLFRRMARGAGFLKYRRSGGVKTSPMPDFFIGAHAEVEGGTLVTRDAPRYRTYFPNLVIIAPNPS